MDLVDILLNNIEVWNVYKRSWSCLYIHNRHSGRKGYNVVVLKKLSNQITNTFLHRISCFPLRFCLYNGVGPITFIFFTVFHSNQVKITCFLNICKKKIYVKITMNFLKASSTLKIINRWEQSFKCYLFHHNKFVNKFWWIN